MNSLVTMQGARQHLHQKLTTLNGQNYRLLPGPLRRSDPQGVRCGMRTLATLPPRRQGRSVSAVDAACPPMNKNQGGEGSSMYSLAKRPLIAPDERGLTRLALCGEVRGSGRDPDGVKNTRR